MDASKYPYNNSRRYISAKDCLTEPEVLKAYCESHPEAVCVGGYGFHGCKLEGEHKENFVKYDHEKRQYIRFDGKLINSGETYCGRKIPCRVRKSKRLYENQLWNRSGLGNPDLVDGNIIIEAKGGLPSLQKMKTAFGQLIFYKELEPDSSVAFLFPRIWLEAENLQKAFEILKKYQVALLPV